MEDKPPNPPTQNQNSSKTLPHVCLAHDCLACMHVSAACACLEARTRFRSHATTEIWKMPCECQELNLVSFAKATRALNH